jgi:rRNA maturation endonuclease Nob1
MNKIELLELLLLSYSILSIIAVVTFIKVLQHKNKKIKQYQVITRKLNMQNIMTREHYSAMLLELNIYKNDIDIKFNKGIYIRKCTNCKKFVSHEFVAGDNCPHCNAKLI